MQREKSEMSFWIELFSDLGLKNGLKLLYCTIERRLGFSKSKDTVQLNILKLDGAFSIRRNTTDVILAKTIGCRNGEYDFLYEDKYKKMIETANVVVDAGANIGIFSSLIRGINRQTEIFAIEAETDNFNLLKRNIESEKTHCINSGLWNRNTGLNVLERGGEWGFCVEETTSDDYDISAISMEEIIKRFEIERINVLKIDIEGAEFEVFDESANEWIDKVDMLLIEIHDRVRRWSALRVFHIMYDHNFEYDIYGDTYVFVRKGKR